MYQCPNCGAGLRFDIPSQQLICDHCGSTLDPYEAEKEKDAEEREEYDVTIFTCPQCGGEVMSTDTTAAGFCSYCGASTVLNSRISNEKKPSFIIPFQKTKDDCKAAYKKMVARTLFAPRELTDPAYLDKFRGFYIPYWVYVVDHNGEVHLTGSRRYRRGDYIITDHYAMNCRVEGTYRGMSYDASSSFDDEISETIAPYDSHAIQKFSPSFLSGFFADTSDVPSRVYEEDARKFASRDVAERVSATPEFHQYNPVNPVGAGMDGTLSRKDSAMFPVWFLTYRKKGRVAYAFVNGQTGKISCDMPVDITRFTIGALLLTIPIFLLLNTFLFLTATTLMDLAAVFATVVSIIYLVNLSALRKKETHANDRGKNAQAAGAATGTMYRGNSKDKAKDGAQKAKKFIAGNIGLLVVLIVAAVQFGVFSILGTVVNLSRELVQSAILMTLMALLGTAITMVLSIMEKKKIPTKLQPVGAITTFAGNLAAFLMAAVNPVNDIYYYGVTIFMFVCMVAALLDLTEKANMLATRPVPAFEREGGDQRG